MQVICPANSYPGGNDQGGNCLVINYLESICSGAIIRGGGITPGVIIQVAISLGAIVRGAIV